MWGRSPRCARPCRRRATSKSKAGRKGGWYGRIHAARHWPQRSGGTERSGRTGEVPSVTAGRRPGNLPRLAQQARDREVLAAPAQCPSLLYPPRAPISPKLLVDARWKWAPARTLAVFARIPSKKLVLAWWRRDLGVIKSSMKSAQVLTSATWYTKRVRCSVPDLCRVGQEIRRRTPSCSPRAEDSFADSGAVSGKRVGSLRSLRALLTMRCYPHIQATLHNVSH